MSRARGRKKAGPQATGRSRGGNTSKLHLATDGVGYVLGWRLTPGPAGDCPEAAGLLAPWLLVPAREVVADAAYDSDALRRQIVGAVAVINSTCKLTSAIRTDQAFLF